MPTKKPERNNRIAHNLVQEIRLTLEGAGDSGIRQLEVLRVTPEPRFREPLTHATVRRTQQLEALEVMKSSSFKANGLAATMFCFVLGLAWSACNDETDPTSTDLGVEILDSGNDSTVSGLDVNFEVTEEVALDSAGDDGDDQAEFDSGAEEEDDSGTGFPPLEIEVRFHEELQPTWRVGVYLVYPDESESGGSLWMGEYVSTPFVTSPAIVSVPVPTLEQTVNLDLGGDKPGAIFYVFAYDDANGDETFLSEPIVGLADRTLLFFYEGATQNLPTWYVIGSSPDPGGPEMHPVNEGFDLFSFVGFGTATLSGTVTNTDGDTPTRVTTLSILELQGDGLLGNPPIDEEMSATFSVTFDQELAAQRITYVEEFGFNVGYEMPVAYVDTNGDLHLNQMEWVDSTLCLDGENVALYYLDSVVEMAGAQFFLWLGLGGGWNAVVMEASDRPDGGDIPRRLTPDEMVAVELNDEICPLHPDPPE